MNIDEIIDIIVDKVIQEIKSGMHEQEKNALVLFTGGKIGFENSVKNIKRLIDNEWKLKVVLSKNAEFIMGSDIIKQKLGIEDVFVEGKIKDINHLKQNVKKIIIPVLTMNSASKIALGISDTLITYLVSWGIMSGIPIIAAKDSCDPENDVRLKLGPNTPEDYNNMIQNNLKKLESYNIRFTSAERLYEDTTNASESLKFSSQPVVLKKRLITTEDIMKAKKDNYEIVVSKDTIVTALAKDMACNIGINIKVEN